MAFKTKYPTFLLSHFTVFLVPLVHTISTEPSPESLPLEAFIFVQGGKTCYDARRRLFLHLCLTASSCASGDQYFNTSVIHSLNAALKSNINGLP